MVEPTQIDAQGLFAQIGELIVINGQLRKANSNLQEQIAKLLEQKEKEAKK